jgi:hypothetical protein
VAKIGLGWRVVHQSAVVVGVSGAPDAPNVVLRETITLLDDPATQEPYHVAAGVPRADAPALIESLAETATAAAASAIRGFVSSLGSVAAVGVVGGDRRLPELDRILTKHALLHAADRNLYEQAIIEGAARAGLPVATLSASGKLFDEASDRVGVALAPALTALGKTIGPPWQKDHKEAAAVALVALAAR